MAFLNDNACLADINQMRSAPLNRKQKIVRWASEYGFVTSTLQL